ncbi:MAG: hypothetical protein F4213_08350 [Boseongicola sp. SB0677_bin_26]|nr:hypothetical protein [Boseongicola sp. SB0677_bin_26]
MTLEAGKTYRIDLKGKDTGDGTLADPYLDGVFDAEGHRIYASWDHDSGEGRNSRATFTAEAGGTHYVDADASGRGTGTYTLAVAEVPPALTPVVHAPAIEDPDDFPAAAGTTGTVAIGGAATGEIERAYDCDWFAVTLEAGKTYRIDLKGKDTGDGTLPNPHLDGIHDAEGNRVYASWDDDGGEGRNSRETFTAEAGGIHYVAAGAHGTDTGTYVLSVTEDAM